MSDINQQLRDMLPRATGVSLFLDGHLGGELFAGLGIDPVSFSRAPTGECLRIDVNAFDGLTAGLKGLLGFLKRCDELFPGRRQIVGVLEDGDESVVIFLPAPRKPNRSSCARQMFRMSDWPPS